MLRSFLEVHFCLPLFGMLSQTLFHSPSLSHSPVFSTILDSLYVCLSHVCFYFHMLSTFITHIQYSHVNQFHMPTIITCLLFYL